MKVSCLCLSVAVLLPLNAQDVQASRLCDEQVSGMSFDDRGIYWRPTGERILDTKSAKADLSKMSKDDIYSIKAGTVDGFSITKFSCTTDSDDAQWGFVRADGTIVIQTAYIWHGKRDISVGKNLKKLKGFPFKKACYAEGELSSACMLPSEDNIAYEIDDKGIVKEININPK